MSLGDDIAREAAAATDEALLAAGHRLAEIAKHNMGVGDPTDDPSPEIAMREHTEVEAHTSGFVTISVNTEYAARQEFDMGLKHPRGGGPRFLQRALAEEAARLEGVVALGVRSAVDGRRNHHRRGGR